MSRSYIDSSGKPCTLDHLVRAEPAWAAARLRQCERVEREHTWMVSAIDAAQDALEHDPGVAAGILSAIAAVVSRGATKDESE